MPENDLLTFLRLVQEECGGVIPFERFMQEALYHPRFGYYSVHIADVGPRGDFSTSATLDEGLGRAIATWIRDRSRAFRWGRTSVIEVGAGSGVLAATVLANLGWLKRLRTDYMIVEASLVLRMRQQKLLGRRGVTWCDSVEEALLRSEGRALIFSNELVDAFPCRLFERAETGWRELGVSIGLDGSLRETTLDRTPDGREFDAFAHLPEGQRVERHDSYRDWQQSWSKGWNEGSMLTIDYGDTAQALYGKRPNGSLRAYWKHRCHTGMEVYARFGRQDMTADVNFSDLVKTGEHQGWETVSLTSQREFLNAWVRGRGTGGYSERFTTEGDAGDAFKVLEQSPGSKRKALLS